MQGTFPDFGLFLQAMEKRGRPVESPYPKAAREKKKMWKPIFLSTRR